MKRTILFVANAAEIGGGNRSLVTNISLLNDTDFEPVLLIPGHGPLEEEINKLNIKYSIFPFKIVSNESRYSIVIKLVKLFFIVKAYNINLICINDMFSYKMFGILGKLLKLPSICHMRFSINSKSVSYYLRPYPNMLIFNSNYLKNKFEANNPIFYNKVICKTIYNGFEPDKYYKPQHRSRIRLEWEAAEKIVIGILGNLAEVKGHELFLEVSKNLLKQNPKLKFLIIGDDILNPDTERRKHFLSELVNSWNLEKHIKFLGFSNDVGEILAGLDILVVPSLYEPFGRVAVEGVLAGIPVVASKVGGLEEILQDNPLGFLVSPINKDNFAEIISSIICNPPSDELKTLGRKKAIDKFGIETCRKKLISVYHEVLSD